MKIWLAVPRITLHHPTKEQGEKMLRAYQYICHKFPAGGWGMTSF